MDIFGTRIFESNEEKALFEEKILEVKHTMGYGGLAAEAKSAYKPSGKSEAAAIPKLLAEGVYGMSLGLLLALGLFLLAWGIFALLGALHLIVFIVYIPAVLLFYFSPLSLPAMAGGRIGKTRWAKSRKPAEVMVCAVIIGLLCAALIVIFIEPWLIKNAYKYWTVVGNTSGSFFNPDMMDGPLGIAVTGLNALACISITPYAARSEMKKKKFCEACENYLNDTVLLRTGLINGKDLLTGLLEGDKDSLLKCHALGSQATWALSDERNELVLASCTCGQTNFVEVFTYYNTGKDNKEHKDMMVLSARFTPQQVTTLKEITTAL